MQKKPVDYLEPWLYLKPIGFVNYGGSWSELKITSTEIQPLCKKVRMEEQI